MKRRRVSGLFILSGMVALIAGCDFPDDPPLKSTSIKRVVEIDSARSLVPMRTGNIWSFLVITRSGKMQSPSLVTALQTTFSGSLYWELGYLYYPPKGIPGGPVNAFPPLLQLSNRALVFNERNTVLDSTGTRYPRKVFMLPYPAEVDSVIQLPRSDYSTRVIGKDVEVQHYDSTASYKCYVYQISYEGREVSKMYVIPGSAIFKIETRDLTYYTIEWKVE